LGGGERERGETPITKESWRRTQAELLSENSRKKKGFDTARRKGIPGLEEKGEGEECGGTPEDFCAQPGNISGHRLCTAPFRKGEISNPSREEKRLFASWKGRRNALGYVRILK